MCANRRSRAPSVGKYSKGQEGWLVGTGCLPLRVHNPISASYLTYYLGPPAVQGWISRNATGSAIPSLNTKTFGSMLVTLLRLGRHCRSAAVADGWATRNLAGDLAEAAQLLETGDGSRKLAVRRAMLTIGLDLAECCDDSYGYLGYVIGEALETYAGTGWRSVGVPPRVFWPDFLEIAIMLGNYGILHRREAELFRLAG